MIPFNYFIQKTYHGNCKSEKQDNYRTKNKKNADSVIEPNNLQNHGINFMTVIWIFRSENKNLVQFAVRNGSPNPYAKSILLFLREKKRVRFKRRNLSLVAISSIFFYQLSLSSLSWFFLSRTLLYIWATMY